MKLYDVLAKLIQANRYDIKYVYLHENVYASEESYIAFEKDVNKSSICKCERLNSGRMTAIEFGIVFKAKDFLVWDNIVTCDVFVNSAYVRHFYVNMHTFDILNEDFSNLPESKAYFLADDNELHIN